MKTTRILYEDQECDFYTPTTHEENTLLSAGRQFDSSLHMHMGLGEVEVGVIFNGQAQIGCISPDGQVSLWVEEQFVPIGKVLNEPYYGEDISDHSYDEALKIYFNWFARKGVDNPQQPNCELSEPHESNPYVWNLKNIEGDLAQVNTHTGEMSVCMSVKDFVELNDI